MPYADSKGVRIWWEEQGEGEPVVAIMGLSFPLAMWHRTAPFLSRHFRMILLDNRGAGKSGSPRGPYTIARMADDVTAVMDAAGVASAHVMGASMGGMIAQELALRHPERVRSLVLGCTWCGGIRAVRPQLRALPNVFEFHALAAEDKMRTLIPLLYTETTPREHINEDIQLRMASLPTSRGYYGQLMGTALWSSWSRLPRIHQPVQILHGEQDRLIPPANADVMARRLGDVRVKKLPRAGHVFTTDQAELANETTLEFLKRIKNGRNAGSA